MVINIDGGGLNGSTELSLPSREKSASQEGKLPYNDEVLSESQMPSLYAAATHYWSMSHGKGWDFPMTEAGATGLRLIAPKHSAYTAYLDKSVAQMIPSTRVPADFNGGKGLGKLFTGSEWWEPDEESATQLIRQAVRTVGDGMPTARARFASELTWEQTAKRLIGILESCTNGAARSFEEVGESWPDTQHPKSIGPQRKEPTKTNKKFSSPTWREPNLLVLFRGD